MYLFLLAVVFLAGLLALALNRPAELSFELDSDRALLRGDLSWLSALRMEAEPGQGGLHVTVYLFRKRVASKCISGTKGGGRAALEALSLRNTSVRADYGMSEPHLTGLLCGAAGALGGLLDTETFEQVPDFVTDHAYVRLLGRAWLHPGKTLANLMRLKYGSRKGRNLRWTRCI